MPKWTSRFPSLPGWPLAFLRISLGVMFLRAVWSKLAAGATWPAHMLGFIHHVEPNSLSFYRSFLQAVVEPHAALFAGLVVAGELYTGLALVFGATTRLACAVGVVMVTNFIWAKGSTFWVPTNHDSLFILILLTLMLAGAGRAAGVDVWLSRKWPGVILW